jgi:hypothetical protein
MVVPKRGTDLCVFVWLCVELLLERDLCELQKDWQGSGVIPDISPQNNVLRCSFRVWASSTGIGSGPGRTTRPTCATRFLKLPHFIIWLTTVTIGQNWVSRVTLNICECSSLDRSFQSVNR